MPTPSLTGLSHFCLSLPGFHRYFHESRIRGIAALLQGRRWTLGSFLALVLLYYH